MADREIVGWFTRGGKRVPIRKGKVKQGKGGGNFYRKNQESGENEVLGANRDSLTRRVDHHIYKEWEKRSDGDPYKYDEGDDVPKGYIKRRSREYETRKRIYGDYINTAYGNVESRDLKEYAIKHKLLNESDWRSPKGRKKRR